MLNLHVRAQLGRVLSPVGDRLARTRITPDALTLTGTAGVVLGSALLLGRGVFFWGVVVVSVFSLTDMLDGALARARGSGSIWGAFLDSTMDRVGDAAVFGSLAFWFARGGHAPVLSVVALICLTAGAVTSYVKARAESLGMTCNVGLAERAERLIVVLLVTGLDGLGLPYVQAVGLWLLAAATVLTVAQRLAAVHRQARQPVPPAKPASAGVR